jgi:hypothetical protein
MSKDSPHDPADFYAQANTVLTFSRRLRLGRDRDFHHLRLSPLGVQEEVIPGSRESGFLAFPLRLVAHSGKQTKSDMMLVLF